MKKFNIKEEKTILDVPYCYIKKQKVIFPDGSEGIWYIKGKTGYSAVILPIMPDGRVGMIRTHKHGYGGIITECCIGLVEENEEPQIAALRELKEEMGITSNKITFLGKTIPSPSSSPWEHHFFLAENCIDTKKQSLEPAEQIEVIYFIDLKSAYEEIMQIQTPVSESALCILSLAKNYFKKNHTNQ